MELRSNEYIEVGECRVSTTGGTLFVEKLASNGYYRRKFRFRPEDGYHTVLSSGSPEIHSYIEVDVAKIKEL